MDTAVRKEFTLQGLDCAHCASEIEQEVGCLKGVRSASVNFTAGTLAIEIEGEEHAEDAVLQAESIAKKHVPDLFWSERNLSSGGARTVFVQNFRSTECAAEIEDRIRKRNGVRSVSFDAVTGRLTLEAYDKDALPGLIRSAEAIVKASEPEASFSFSEAGPEDGGEKKKEFSSRISLAVSAVLFAAALLLPLPRPVRTALYLASYLMAGGEILLRAAVNIRRGRAFDENFLMSVATIGAFIIGEFAEGAAVMLFCQVGELFQRLAVGRSRRSIAALMNIRPDFANLLTGGGVVRVAPEEVGKGECVLVRPGEKVPLDGEVLEGSSSLDVSALTGESVPKDVFPGDAVLSGSVNRNGALTVKVAKEYSESTVARILELVQSSGSRKAVTENFITRFARWYTPAVVFSALALAVLPPLLAPGQALSVWVGRALVFLVVSCPCALVLSVPLGFFGGIGAASRNGILIKGGNYLEALCDAGTIVFDKTGTLTKGVFRVSEICGAGGMSEDALLELAAYAEADSNHPIAQSIRGAYGKEIDRSRVASARETAGMGIRVQVDGKTVLAGSRKLLEEEGIACEAVEEPGTVVYLAAGGVYAGYLLISDEIREDSRGALDELRRQGAKRLVMLTGDGRAAGERIAEKLGLDAAFTELLPEEKVEKFEMLQKQTPAGKKTVFVGDGINDAPVLAAADVGVAMGGGGSDAAIEAADVVLMTDEPSKLADAVRIARRTRRIVRQNIVFALAVKGIILVLGAFGIATMWAAVFGDVGVAVLAVFNSMRTLRLPRSSSSRYRVPADVQAD